MASIQGGDIEKQSDETYQLLCSPCKRKERNREADKYCADCNDYYCCDCVKVHEDIPYLSGHKILDAGEATQGTSKGLPIAPTERCERHRFKTVDMYCQNHDDVGCYTCMAVDHRSCKDIFDIPEFVQNNNASQDSEQLKEELLAAKEDLKETLDICIREKDRLLNTKGEELQKVYEFRKEIDRTLDELEQTRVAAIEKKFQVLIEKINNEMQLLESAQTEVICAEEKMASSGRNISQNFVTSKKGKRAVESAAKCREEYTPGKHDISIEFKKDETLLAFIAEMDGIGKIRQSNQLYKVLDKKKYNVRHHSDKNTCTIKSACILEDGSIVLVDESNRKLKRIDSTFTHVDFCDLPGSPWQICPANKQDVAVTYRFINAFSFISVGKELNKTKEIKTDHGCYGIASAKDILYVSDSNTTVFLYTMSGIKLKQYTKDHQSGKALFSNIWGITVREDGSRIFVSDYKYGLVILSGDGRLLGKYDCSELEHVLYVCLAPDGHCFASGDTNNCILQFTPDGEKKENVLSSDAGKGGSGAVCFDNKKCSLLVGHEKSDEIDIYYLM